MAEAVAFVSSVIAIIQITDRIIDVCKFYLESVQGTPSDLRIILIEISALKTVLENVKFLALCPDNESLVLDSLSNRDGPIEQCLKSIGKLEGLFPQDTAESAGSRPKKRQKFNSTLATLAWPFKAKKAKNLLDEISVFKSTITLALTADITHDIKSVKGQTSEIHRKLTESQFQEILKWLNHTDPSPLFYQALENYEPNTGQWILRLREWMDWLELRHRCLWIHGIPGAGKTVLISNLFEQTRRTCEENLTQKCACVYYYCYYGHKQDETLPFLLWLLNVLCRQADRIPEEIVKMYKIGGQPELLGVMKAVEDILINFERVCVFIDAIDESQSRKNILRVLRDFVIEPRYQKIQLLASSREYADIEQIMGTISTPVSMAHPSIEDDIRICMRSMLQSNSKFSHWSSDLLSEVEDSVSKGAKGMFRWAVCQIDALQRLKGDRKIVKDALANLPKNLYETYDRVTIEVPEDEQIFVQHVLYWICFHLEIHGGQGDLCINVLEAVARSTASQGIDLSARYYDVEMIQQLCGCLVKIVSPMDRHWSHYPFTLGSKSENVVFAHFTVREYLDASRYHTQSTLYSAECKGSLWRSFKLSILNGACCVERNELWERGDARYDSTEIIDALENNFNVYSLVSASVLLQKFDKALEEPALLSLAVDVVNPYKQSWMTAKSIIKIFLAKSDKIPPRWEIFWEDGTDNPDAAALVNMLHLVASSSPQADFVRNFLRHRDADSLIRKPLRCTKVLYFDENEKRVKLEGSLSEVLIDMGVAHAPTIEVLLDYDQGFSNLSNMLQKYLRQRYFWDSDSAHLVERLLRNGADPNISNYLLAPLQLAAVFRDTDIIKILLKAGANPNGTGDVDEKVLKDQISQHHFGFLLGASPLCIYRHWAYSVDKHEYKEGEATLIGYGAQDFSIKPGVPRDCKSSSQISPSSFANCLIWTDSVLGHPESHSEHRKL